MLLVKLLLSVVIFSNVVSCNNYKSFDETIDRSNRTTSVLTSSVAINQTISFGSNPDLRSGSLVASAVLIEPSSRAYKCFLKTKVNCKIFKFNDSIGMNTRSADFPEEVPNNGETASDGNPIYNMLNYHSTSRWSPSHLKIREYNRTHFVSEIIWIVNEKALEVDNIKVYLSNSNYTDDQPIQKSALNLVCLHRNNNRTRMQNYAVRFHCYIQTEFITDLFYGAQGLGILVSTLKIVGTPYAFYQVADISLHKSVKEIINFHGFVPNPPSRAQLCQLRVNKNCGQVTYEPQSVEGFKGFPYGINSPPDGKIASANNYKFDQLNEYGINRWVRVEFPVLNCYNQTHVYFNLTWYFTATHSSDNIRIYINNEKYTSAEPLSRRHLDLTPLCSVQFHGQHPPSQLTISCPISLNKYRQISKLRELLLLSVWDVKDTPFAFYQVIDLQKISEKQILKNMQNRC